MSEEVCVVCVCACVCMRACVCDIAGKSARMQHMSEEVTVYELLVYEALRY